MSIDSDVDLMDGLFAFDTGCVTSGIKNDTEKDRFRSDADYSFNIATILLKAHMANDDYGIEDAKRFIEWIEEELEFDI